MNKQRLNRMRLVAKRTLKILDCIEDGLSAGEIVQKTGANRQLVDYYINALTKEEK